MENNSSIQVRLSKISIKDYKAIDHLDLLFPNDEEYDVYALGSENGVGKTAVLDCIAEVAGSMAFRQCILGGHNIWREKCRYNCHSYEINGTFEIGNITRTISSKTGNIDCRDKAEELNRLGLPNRSSPFTPDVDIELGFHFLYLKCNRIVQNGSVPVYMDVREEPADEEDPNDVSFIYNVNVTDDNPNGDPKQLHILRDGNEYIGQKNNFDKITSNRIKKEIVWTILKNSVMLNNGKKDKVDWAIIEVVDKLLKKFARVKLDFSQFKHLPSSPVNLMVCDIEDEKKHFPLDGLSSGQKEIISTLFLVWYYTRDGKSIVLIDEPELHLNMSWQLSFVQMLKEIAPNNQYILATHSEAVMRCIPKGHRILLSR